jgi:protein-tyrosine phosphatase
LFWIDGPWLGRLAISPRPRGGDWLEDEIKGWRAFGINTVVSLLTPDEEESLDLQHEEQFCRNDRLSFVSFPIVDRSVPVSQVEAMRLIERLDNELSQGKNVLVHCRQGVGRAGLIAASLLVARGTRPEDAMKRVSESRQLPVPETSRQVTWITDDFPSTLGAAGSLFGER